MEELQEIIMGNFLRIAQFGIDISFLVDPSISKEKFIQKLEELFNFLVEISDEEKINEALPEIKKILDNPDLKEEELKRLNTKITQIVISPVTNQLEKMYEALKESAALAKDEEKKNYNTLLEVVHSFIEAYNYLEDMLGEETIEKGREAIKILGEWDEKQIMDFVLNSRKFLETVALDYSQLYVDKEELTKEVVEGDEFFQNGVSLYFSALETLEEAINEDDSRKLKEAINLAYQADDALNKLHKLAEEVKQSAEEIEKFFHVYKEMLKP